MTSAVNMINLQIRSEDQIKIDKAIIDPETGKSLYDLNVAQNEKHYIWQSSFQTIPQGMDGRPEQFAQKLREALPEVNTLRLGFNEFSFNPDGSLHTQYERFLAEAVAQGFEICFVYTGGDVQNIGNSASKWGHGDLSNAEAYAALEENFADVSGAWGALLDWLDAHGDVAAGTYGLELMNEPAGYRHSIRENGAGQGYELADFVGLYTDHVLALSDMLRARSDAKILVEGWGYAGDFATLAETELAGGLSAIETIRQGLGDALIWSAHLYPGWADTGTATSVAEIEARLEAHFAVLAGDAILVTETNAHGFVDSFQGGENVTDHMVAAYEWFAQNDIGLGWFPGAETGGSNFVVIDYNGSMRFLHQHSYAHGMNAFSLGEERAALAGADDIAVTLVAGRLRNESYEADYAQGQFDSETLLGTGFGFGGDDRLTGTDLSNDFLYGGFGNDTLRGERGDDFLFGQQGNDFLYAGGDIDHLFGGSGNDRLFGGAGYDQMRGGRGHDVFATDGAGDDVILDFSVTEDLIDLGAPGGDWSAILAALADLDADGDGRVDDVRLTTPGGGSITLTDVVTADLTASHFMGAVAPDGWVDGTEGDDLIASGIYADYQGETVSESGARIYGHGGSDTITGSAGRDRLSGGSGNDVIDGGGGRDRIAGGGGHDRALGGDGNDVLAGQGGRDTLRGGRGADDLAGGGGRDVLWGQAGADRLSGGGGNDRLSGGGGADVFVFTGRDGADVITDFTPDEDLIDLSAIGTGFAALSIRQQGGDTVIDVARTTITLRDLDMEMLTQDAFAF